MLVYMQQITKPLVIYLELWAVFHQRVYQHGKN